MVYNYHAAASVSDKRDSERTLLCMRGMKTNHIWLELSSSLVSVYDMCRMPTNAGHRLFECCSRSYQLLRLKKMETMLELVLELVLPLLLKDSLINILVSEHLRIFIAWQGRDAKFLFEYWKTFHEWAWWTSEIFFHTRRDILYL